MPCGKVAKVTFPYIPGEKLSKAANDSGLFFVVINPIFCLTRIVQIVNKAIFRPQVLQITVLVTLVKTL